MNQGQDGKSQLIENRQEITRLLNLARQYLWKFAFSVPDQPGNAFPCTEIFHVNPEGGHLTVSSEVNSLCPDDNSPLHFAGRDAGITIEFDSTTLPYPGNPLAYRFASERRIAFPKKISVRQSRTTERVNLSELRSIPFVLFTESGNRLTGVIEDISRNGVRARFPGYLMEHFDEPNLVVDCEFYLPTGITLVCQLEVLGSTFEFSDDASYARGRFVDLDEEDQTHILNFIDYAQQQLLIKKTA